MRRFTILASLGALALVSAGCSENQPEEKTQVTQADQALTPVQAVIEERCASCHESTGSGHKRLDVIRKTPEGWDMTLARMMIWHQVSISADERRLLVKHFSDTQGLAPSEAAMQRAILERQPGLVENPDDPLLAEICGRCHSNGRYALQRRDQDEWLKLVHTHVGQFPSIEWQAMARDRAWWDIATGEAVAKLAANYPLKSAAWDDWKARPVADLTGTWRVTGQRAGKGAYQGSVEIAASDDGNYTVASQITYDDGTQVSGAGRAVLYTGYEWRAAIDLGEESINEVFALSEDGNSMRGRWFRDDADEIGGRALLVRELSGKASVMAVSPQLIRVGETSTISIRGTGLTDAVNLGDGVAVTKVISAGAREVLLEVSVAADAAPGPREVRVGDAVSSASLALYQQIDSVGVEPAVNIARVGGNGGTTPPVMAQFEAVAYLNGPDNQPQTEDDIRLGVVPASWATLNNGEAAEAMEDTKYAGTIDTSGLFHPAVAGPNPERPMSANNAGDLLVQATVDDNGRSLQGQAHLIVTVQRWNNPPIR